MSKPCTQGLLKEQLPEATLVESNASGNGQETQQSQRPKNREARMRHWTQAPTDPGGSHEKKLGGSWARTANASRSPTSPQAGRQPQPPAFRTPQLPPKHGLGNRPTPWGATAPSPKKATGPRKGKQWKPQTPPPPSGADQPRSRPGLDRRERRRGRPSAGLGPKHSLPPWGNGPHFGHFSLHFGSLSLMP